jgi:pimeloyl-ACP methyl ester carboxylesterase
MKNFTASDGIRLNYVVDDFTDPWKPKETLIMLYAVLGSLRRFYQWIPVLSRHIRMVHLDMRGHGDSEVPDGHHFLRSHRAAQ